MPNQTDPNFNKNVSMVYVEQPGFTGYKGLDFTKLDNIEDLLREGVVISGSLINLIKANTDSIQNITTSIDNKLFVTGDAGPGGVQGTIVFQADLSPQFDGVVTFPEQSTGISNFLVSGSNGKILNENSFRREFYVQNLDTGVLYVKYGLAASASSFNFLLSANSATNAGDGGSLNDQAYVGHVSVSGLNTPRYISWERS